MSNLPIPFDVAQIRRQAKDLRALALGGDRIARERIRRTHPRFGRGRIADADLVGFTLRDAQLCLARELGFDGWREVLSYAQGNVDVDRPWRRWPDELTHGISRRAERVSREAGHRHIGPEHALGALLRVDEKTLASEVLDEFGINWELWIARRKIEGVEERGRRFNPAWYRLLGMAEGIALADGADRMADEHLLLASHTNGAAVIRTVSSSSG